MAWRRTTTGLDGKASLEVADGGADCRDHGGPDNQKSYTGIGLMTGSKVGGYCWIDFDGEEVASLTANI